MPTFRFGKLVRDKIVEQQISSGAQPHYHRLDGERYKQEIVQKIIEEAREIAAADQQDIVGEIADVQQALDDFKERLGLTTADISKAQRLKNAKNGPFKKGIFVDYVRVDEANEWVTYYRQHADRYPEIPEHESLS